MIDQPRGWIWPLAGVLCLVGSLRAQQPQSVYLKVQFDQPLIDFANPDSRQEAFAKDLIAALREDHQTRYFVWRLEAAKPSDHDLFPELRIFVRRDLAQRDWLMQVVLTLKKDPSALQIKFEPKGILDRGEFDGDYPPGEEKGVRVKQRFLRQFVQQPIVGMNGDRKYLREHMWQCVPVAKARLDAKPPLARGQALLLLPFNDVPQLRKSSFRVVCRKQGGDEVEPPMSFEARASSILAPLGKQTIRMLLMAYRGQATDLDGLAEGWAYLKQFVETDDLATDSEESSPDGRPLAADPTGG